jgi:hypothetical protein
MARSFLSPETMQSAPAWMAHAMNISSSGSAQGGWGTGPADTRIAASVRIASSSSKSPWGRPRANSVPARWYSARIGGETTNRTSPDAQASTTREGGPR